MSTEATTAQIHTDSPSISCLLLPVPHSLARPLLLQQAIGTRLDTTKSGALTAQNEFNIFESQPRLGDTLLECLLG